MVMQHSMTSAGKLFWTLWEWTIRSASAVWRRVSLKKQNELLSISTRWKNLTWKQIVLLRCWSQLRVLLLSLVRISLIYSAAAQLIHKSVNGNFKNIGGIRFIEGGGHCWLVHLITRQLCIYLYVMKFMPGFIGKMNVTSMHSLHCQWQWFIFH